jgi:hypothetical protein
MTGAIKVVKPENLGIDFDLGAQTASKVNIVFASNTVYGKVRYATSAEFNSGAANVAIDAATLKLALSEAIPFATQNSAGVIIVGNYLVIVEGVLSVAPSVEFVSVGGAHLAYAL